MPEYPVINDNEVSLLKKIAENTADLAAGGGGGGAVSSVFGRAGAVTAQNGDYTKAQVGLSDVDNTSDADKPISTATQSALDEKAPINNPVLTGEIGLESDANGIYMTVNGQQAVNIDEQVFQLRKPLTENPRDVGDGDPSTVEYTDLIVNYVRTDAAPLVFPDPASSVSGQNLKIVNSSGDAISLDGAVAGSFFNGSLGTVNSIAMAADETISFVAIENAWRVVNRYLTNSGGVQPISLGGTGATTAAGAIDALITAETDVASAGTTDLGAVASRNVRITGTTAITSFGTATAGIMRFGRFAAGLTLTHNATSLILPGGANISTSAGDRFIALSLGSGNWFVQNYQRNQSVSLGSAAFASTNDFLLSTQNGFPLYLPYTIGDETTDLTTGNAKLTFRSPSQLGLTEVRINVNTAPAGSTIIVDVNAGGVSIFSTRITIDAGEETSQTAAVPYVFSNPVFLDDQEITVDIDQVGSVTPGKGLKITFIGVKFL